MATEIDDALYIKLPNGETKHLGITSVATQTSKGLMSAEDKVKLDSLSAGSGGGNVSLSYDEATETLIVTGSGATYDEETETLELNL